MGACSRCRCCRPPRRVSPATTPVQTSWSPCRGVSCTAPIACTRPSRFSPRSRARGPVAGRVGADPGQDAALLRARSGGQFSLRRQPGLGHDRDLPRQPRDWPGERALRAIVYIFHWNRRIEELNPVRPVVRISPARRPTTSQHSSQVTPGHAAVGPLANLSAA
jgi:hypothetical protein